MNVLSASAASQGILSEIQGASRVQNSAVSVTLLCVASTGGAMAHPRLNELFARYRNSGDPKDLGRVFDECAPGLLRVARRLSRDAAGAEDLLQETFLAVIEHSDAWDSSRPVGPWLMGILTNRARTARRRVGREVAPDRLEIREPGSPEEDLQGAELELAVREALQDLPEGERAAVGARLFEGLSGPEIAERFGISSGLGRVRLHRGLQRLRAALPAGLSLGVGGIVLPGSTLARVKSAVLAEAARASGSSAVPPVYAVGSVAALKAVGAAAGLAAVFLGALAHWKDADTVPPLPDSQLATHGADPATLVVDDEGSQQGSTQERAPIAAAQVTTESDAPETLSIVARVVDAATGAPLAGLVVRATDARGRSRQWKELTSDHEGRICFPVRAGSSFVSFQVNATDTTGEVRKFVNVGELNGEVLVEISSGGTFEGRVVDRDGNPVPGAELMGWCSQYGADKDAPHRTAKADSQGRFRIEKLGPLFHLMARADGYASNVGYRGEIKAGGTVSGLELELARSGFVEGFVVDLDGRGIEGVKITSKPSFQSSSWYDQTPFSGIHKLFGRWTDTESGARGDFRAGPVPKGGNGTQLTFEAPGYLRLSKTFKAGASPHRVTLDPGLSLVGEVRLPDGTPAKGASLIVGPHLQDPNAKQGLYTTDSNGRFRANGFSLPTDSPFEAPPFVFVSMPGYAIALAQPVEPSRRPEEHVARITLVPEWTVGGHVLWPDGSPAVDVTLKIEGERLYDAEAEWSHPPTWEWKAGVDEVRSAADGRFVFKQLGSGSYKVYAMDPADSKRRITVDAVAGGDPLDIVMDPKVMDGRTIEGVVLNAATGDPIPEFRVIPSIDGMGMNREFRDNEGRFRMTGVGVGPVTIGVTAEGFVGRSLPEEDFGDAVSLELKIWPETALRFRVVDENGDLRKGQCVLRVSDVSGSGLMIAKGLSQTASVYRTTDPGRGRLFGLPATHVVVNVACQEESADFPLDLSVTGEEEIEFVLPRTPPVPFGSAAFILAYLPGRDPVKASEVFARFQRAVAAGENPPLESALTMEQIDPVLASFEVTMIHESGKRKVGLAAKLLVDGQLELTEFSEDLRKLASGTKYWGHSGPRKSAVPDFYIDDWAGVWNVTATSDTFQPYTGQVVIPELPEDRDRIPALTFIKVERR